MIYFILLLMAVMGYLFGSLNFAVIIGKLFYKTDVRQHGSGNAGATNVQRTLGSKAAAFVALGDFLKGIAAYFIAYLVGGIFEQPVLFGCICGFAAVIGHNYPLYFHFKGGKGILTSLGLSFAIDWRAALITLAVSILIIALTRYVSLGSILGCIANVGLILLFDADPLKIWFIALLAVLAVIRHHANIKRLIKGEEAKLGAKKKG
ncbi:glycerol-3-phosphate 1-O-acyltransferase PlsY [Acetivibrio sp. MSJd-27]|uniref:glycerol-3-phosphate 1-O-acyltransferase PlsY n=1 Tax=Acetivibrio sp. MSJd-27 TaxID=2841523 RepID=UPI001C111C9D|nr:glycerol-3-phosphate 1-O-acyltransferase PlsY [Acetivibrio sp. MSJd-27]MBU5449565.1 glycerol-3-phosphate 1-O-acyltransferase PlsY [Acetivibrio sp. MSJd-27]